MNDSTLKKVSFFEQIIAHSKYCFGEHLINSSIGEDKTESKYLFLQFSFIKNQDTAWYPTFTHDGTGGIYESIHTVLNVYVDAGNLATFYFEGNISEKGFYAEPESDSSEDTCFSIQLDQPEEYVDVINYINSFQNKHNVPYKSEYKFEKVNTSLIISETYVFIPQFSNYMVEYDKIRGVFSIAEFLDSAKQQYLPDNIATESMSEKDVMENFKQKSALHKNIFQEMKNQFLGLIAGATSIAREGDIFLENQHTIVGYHEKLREEINYVFDKKQTSGRIIKDAVKANPCVYIVFRLGNKTSYMSMHGFLSNSTEGVDFVKEFRLQNKMPETVVYIDSPELGTQYSIENKYYRFSIEQRLKGLLKEKGCYQKEHDLLQNRLKKISKFYHQNN